MIQKRRLLVNALVSALQVAIIGGTFFVLYGFLRKTIGEDRFAVWALVLATTSASNIANLGLSASTLKYVSQYLAHDDTERVSRIIQTAFLTISIVLGLFLIVAYQFLDNILALIIESPRMLEDALMILPYSLASFWFTSVGAVFLSGIEGFHRVDQRGYLLSGVALLYLGLAFLLVPKGGLIGIAQAQVIQASVLFVGSWILLKRLLPALPLWAWRWYRPVFKEILGYSLNFQVISFTQLLFDPIIKPLVFRFGGGTTLANFEFAYRMVFQIRALLATTHQAIIPTIADLQEKAPDYIQDLYKKSYQLLLFLLVPSVLLLIAVTPLISRLWIGYYEPEFVLFSTLLFIAWSVNLTSNPAYFANMGIGHLRWNVISHITMGVLNGGLGLLLGWQFGGVGVVVGLCIAIMTSSLALSLAYQHRYSISFAELIQPATLWLGLAGLLGLALTYWLYNQLQATWPLWSLILLVLGVYLTVIAFPLWHHPMLRQVLGWLGSLLPQRRNETPTAQP